VLMSDEQLCNVLCVPRPVTSRELMATGILFMELLERMSTQYTVHSNLPHTIQQLEACYSGRNCEMKSRADGPSVSQLRESFKTMCCR